MRKALKKPLCVDKEIYREAVQYLDKYYTEWHFDLLNGKRNDWLNWREETRYFAYLDERCPSMESTRKITTSGLIPFVPFVSIYNNLEYI